MVVAADATWGSIGGGNLEATAVARARAMLSPSRAPYPSRSRCPSTTRRPPSMAQQCCGGEVQVLLEPLAVVPAVAIFGVGHVGLELARILARHDLELHLVDSRADQLGRDRLGVLDDASARVTSTTRPSPSWSSARCPRGTHVLVMTHDHAEDAALCDGALRCAHLGSIGLIGSSAKWSRFRQRLAAEGHDSEATSRASRRPIGLPDAHRQGPGDHRRERGRRPASGRSTRSDARCRGVSR